MKFKFAIITPTLLRSSLVRACDSVDDMFYESYLHIIVVDKKAIGENYKDRELLLKKLQRKNRIILIHSKSDADLNDYGNSARNFAYDYIYNCDYILYLDDDDYYLGNALARLNEAIGNLGYIEAFYFPCQRFGSIFFNHPPAVCKTTSNQWGIKPEINGEKMQWPKAQGYLSDGEFLEWCKTKANFLRLNTEPLVCVDEMNSGKL